MANKPEFVLLVDNRTKHWTLPTASQQRCQTSALCTDYISSVDDSLTSMTGCRSCFSPIYYWHTYTACFIAVMD